MPDPASLIDEWVENLLRDIDPEYARESLWSRLGIRPQPGPQDAFLKSDAGITIFGGAAGGGKSFGLLLAPLQWIACPRVRRRHLPPDHHTGPGRGRPLG